MSRWALVLVLAAGCRTLPPTPFVYVAQSAGTTYSIESTHDLGETRKRLAEGLERAATILGGLLPLERKIETVRVHILEPADFRRAHAYWFGSKALPGILSGFCVNQDANKIYIRMPSAPSGPLFEAAVQAQLVFCAAHELTHAWLGAAQCHPGMLEEGLGNFVGCAVTGGMEGEVLRAQGRQSLVEKGALDLDALVASSDVDEGYVRGYCFFAWMSESLKDRFAPALRKLVQSVSASRSLKWAACGAFEMMPEKVVENFTAYLRAYRGRHREGNWERSAAGTELAYEVALEELVHARRSNATWTKVKAGFRARLYGEPASGLVVVEFDADEAGPARALVHFAFLGKGADELVPGVKGEAGPLPGSRKAYPLLTEPSTGDQNFEVTFDGAHIKVWANERLVVTHRVARACLEFGVDLGLCGEGVGIEVLSVTGD